MDFLLKVCILQEYSTMVVSVIQLFKSYTTEKGGFMWSYSVDVPLFPISMFSNYTSLP